MFQPRRSVFRRLAIQSRQMATAVRRNSKGTIFPGVMYALYIISIAEREMPACASIIEENRIVRRCWNRLNNNSFKTAQDSLQAM